MIFSIKSFSVGAVFIMFFFNSGISKGVTDNEVSSKDSITSEFVGEFQMRTQCSGCHIRGEVTCDRDGKEAFNVYVQRLGTDRKYILPSDGAKDTVQFSNGEFQIIRLPDDIMIGRLVKNGEVIADIEMILDE